MRYDLLTVSHGNLAASFLIIDQLIRLPLDETIQGDDESRPPHGMRWSLHMRRIRMYPLEM